MDEIKSRLLALREEAKRRLRAEPEAQLAIALRSEGRDLCLCFA